VRFLYSLAFIATLQPSYPSLNEYLMPRDAELALARSAAPAAITDHATFKVLTPNGYEVAQRGDNGFVCLVLRGWSAPTFTPTQERELVYDSKVRAPICYNAIAARTVVPYQDLRTKLAMAGKSPDEIAALVKAAYDSGKLPKMEQVGFAYMFSADSYLGPGIGAFHPHMMAFTPYYDNAMLGGNEVGGRVPFVAADAGTPFTVSVIPVDPSLAIKAY
jgi:hypothetical protein